MTLADEIKTARKEVVADGYEMSIGEVMNVYRDKELTIDPAFQRLFRWDDTRKTRFIESLLLGIPIPPIFVYQDENGVWELIDGLQRLSTIFQFTNILRNADADADADADAELNAPLVLRGTNFLPSLAGKVWANSENNTNGIGSVLQLDFKRARLRVEILKKESDPQAKYELFQRLNTGGVSLSEQEVRNCVAVMMNKDFYDWLITSSNRDSFVNTIKQTERAKNRQAPVELVLRFLAFRHVSYSSGLDVHEYLDKAMAELAVNEQIDFELEAETFNDTFDILYTALADRAFTRWDGTKFSGMFLQSVFEVLAIGTSKNLAAINAMDENDRTDFLNRRAKALWENNIFNTSTGAGVSGTTRLARLLPIAENFLDPALE